LSFHLPAPLRAGDTVFITAPSDGVDDVLRPRFELALETLRARGLQVRLGQHLFGAGVVADAAARAAEWQGALLDPEVHWVCAPWGGELAIELLPHVDFERLRGVRPKWVSGFSDLSTLMLPLSLMAGWATVHGPNLMELASDPLDPMTAGLFELVMGGQSREWLQLGSERHAGGSADWARQPAAPLALDAVSRPRPLRDGMALRAEGRLIGGCLETVARIAGTRYAPWAALPGPKLLYLEACEAGPFEMARTLHSLSLHGWFEELGGLLIGRSAAPSDPSFDGWSALQALFPHDAVPVFLDLDIGHRPPQWSLLNGAWACCELAEGRATLRQRIP
jgi:muramoyltetrapeptide carboxypeptidase